MEAEIAKGFLETYGVESQLQADDEGGMAPFPFKPTTKGVRLLVQEDDFHSAEKLLESR